MPIHLRAESGDYAPNVLCPGDPRRAAYIAETFFDPGYRMVNEERGMLGFTGTFEGAPISVQTTGMGAPSSGIVFEELAMLGVERFVRVGTCGGLKDGMQMGDTVVGISATAEDQTPLRLAQMDSYAPTGTFTLAETAARLARESGATVHVGAVVTSGVFYDPDSTTFARWKRTGHIGVEMEAAMMYTVAALRGLEALAIMTVSDLLEESGDTSRISDEELKQGVDAMMRLACRVATSD
ncbi:purine-nucleoside phosphorylase [Ilumatobacter fluminis]|uniref:Uridine phosphorylase n=1 Tax=Ilumatobacter fluminis TaxID=467091 RepID=A0A4R7I272_9ACTN|nr:purine-nucleoside phosphorylase [Ilumatobacter fluminis]TDT17692.1 purine-nucleoside phosphorylase [Ilumatobacter fluminis]